MGESGIGGLSLVRSGVLFYRCFPRCGAGVLSFASPKESSQRKGDPGSVAPAGLPCATRVSRGRRKLGALPLRHACPFSAKPCVARHLSRGKGKTIRIRVAVGNSGFFPYGREARPGFCDGSTSWNLSGVDTRQRDVRQSWFLAVAQNSETQIPSTFAVPHFQAAAHSGVPFPFPLEDAEQRRRAGGLRLAMSESRSGEFSQPPGPPSSARHPAQRGVDHGGRLLFAYFFLAKQEKVRRAAARKTTVKQHPRTNNRQNANPASPDKIQYPLQRKATPKPPVGITPRPTALAAVSTPASPHPIPPPRQECRSAH